MTTEANEQFPSCLDCDECLEVCPTYTLTGEDLFSPRQRLLTAARLLEGETLEAREVESLYNCPKCMRCESVCPQQIPVTRIIHRCREVLAQRGAGPLEPHRKVISGIMEKHNAVNGDPSRRLDWLPEPRPVKSSDTLLYLGCLPSYLVKEAAVSTYLVLKKLGLDFMIIEDEGCCGTYLYESGRIDLALDLFQANAERFASLGIRRIIVPCSGCLKCFKYFYPELLGKTDFTVRHAVEVVHELLAQHPDVLRKLNKKATYQDSCRLARGEGITEEPRQILRSCGVELEEAEHSREQTVCCGAGGGIRSVYRDLSTGIAVELLNEVPTESLVSACPFCTFNLNYAAKKNGIEKRATYFTSWVLEALEE
jgi:heterodisulfide reductase subunit D